jgi:murein DD-endopeptidase MepM/ murein hydrolase activator NlpD
MKQSVKLVITLVTAGVVMTCGCVIGIPMAWFGATQPLAGACGTIDLDEAALHGSADGQWSAVQFAHAVTIVEVGIEEKVPARGWTVALATAMQESNLLNYANDNPAYPGVEESLTYPHDAVGHDHDSLGLFQQRWPSWGEMRELMDPATAAKKFYNALEQVEGWEDMSITAAAQAVQRSAYPDAYAKWEAEAQELADLITSGAADAIAAWGCGAGSVTVSEDGWTVPVSAEQGEFWGGFRTDSRPDHDGVDIGAASGVPIHASSAGTVRYSECNSPTCDVPGSPEMGGCGWMTVIDHAGGIATRYCHMVSEPLVAAGDTVQAGQVIGYVGSTGNSSAPHLHYEVHYDPSTGDRLGDDTAVDPVPFHEQVGASIT